jgi:hypothetical protein
MICMHTARALSSPPALLPAISLQLLDIIFTLRVPYNITIIPITVLLQQCLASRPSLAWLQEEPALSPRPYSSGTAP